jgi:uncharacterized protein
VLKSFLKCKEKLSYCNYNIFLIKFFKLRGGALSKQNHHTSNNSARSFVKFILKWRYIVILLSVAILFSGIYGSRYLGFENNYRVIFGKNNPQLKAFEALENIYTKNDNVLIVLAPRNGNVFTKSNLSAIELLTKQCWQIPYSTRVDSITNFQHTTVKGDNLYVADLVSKADQMKLYDIKKIKTIALNEPLLVNRLVSSKGHVAGINVTVQLPPSKPFAVMEVAGYVRHLKETFQKQHPSFDVHLTGLVMVNEAFPRISIQDMKTLIPAMYAIIAIIMFILLFRVSRSLWSIVETLCVLGLLYLTIKTTMGIAGWMGIKLTPYSSIAPTIILTIGVADSIHFLTHVLLSMRRNGMSKIEAIIDSMKMNLKPIFLTSVTTVVGFLALNFSDVPPYHDLGNITAIGISIAFLLTIVLLPVILSMIPLKVKTTSVESKATMEKLSKFVIHNHNILRRLIGATAISLAALVPFIQLNDNIIDYFSKKTEFRQASEFTMNNLTGISRIEYSIDSGEIEGISQPKYLKKLDDFSLWFKQQPNVVHVDTFSDTMKRLNRTLHADSPVWYKIPERNDLAAQYLLLYEMSLPYGLELTNQIDIKKSSTRFIVTLGDVPSHIIRDLSYRGEQWLKNNSYPSMHAVGSGTSVIFAHISKRNLNSMIKGGVLALIFITFLMMISFRSVRYGLISMIPNLAPACMAFGVWFLIFGKVNTAIATAAAVTFGIVVDDTIHFLNKYISGRRQGLDTLAAIQQSFSSTGVAIVITSVILTLGFGILMLSPFLSNWALGVLSSLTLIFAVLLDLFLLPTLLIKFDAGGIKNV